MFNKLKNEKGIYWSTMLIVIVVAWVAPFVAGSFQERGKDTARHTSDQEITGNAGNFASGYMLEEKGEVRTAKR